MNMPSRGSAIVAKSAAVLAAMEVQAVFELNHALVARGLPPRWGYHSMFEQSMLQWRLP